MRALQLGKTQLWLNNCLPLVLVVVDTRLCTMRELFLPIRVDASTDVIFNLISWKLEWTQSRLLLGAGGTSLQLPSKILFS